VKLHKTDRRFKLYHYGFDCYVQFTDDDWNSFNRAIRYCRSNFGAEFWMFNAVVYRHNGKWRSEFKNQKRIYLRGEKYYTLLSLAMSMEEKDTFYL